MFRGGRFQLTVFDPVLPAGCRNLPETPDAVEPADDHAADPAASATTLLSNLIDEEDLFLQSDEEDLEKQRKRPWRV